MDAKELRIGNFILNPLLKEVKEVTEIKIARSVIDNHKDKNLLYYVYYLGLDNKEVHAIASDCQPIPLTEEWFTKLGFKEEIPKHPWKGPRYFFKTNSPSIKKIRLYKNNRYDFYFYSSGSNFSRENAHLKYKYVHQLQNLYFAITGSELTNG